MINLVELDLDTFGYDRFDQRVACIVCVLFPTATLFLACAAGDSTWRAAQQPDATQRTDYIRACVLCACAVKPVEVGGHVVVPPEASSGALAVAARAAAAAAASGVVPRPSLGVVEHLLANQMSQGSLAMR